MHPNWPDWPAVTYDPNANVVKTYPELDFDRFPYLVCNFVEKGCPVAVIVNQVDLPIAFTTGVRAVDLREFGLKGKQPVELRLQFSNTGHSAKIDYFRFVGRLSPEESKGLIPPGFRLRKIGVADRP
jgi:hypothetical protein